jgi:hypothetical protein
MFVITENFSYNYCTEALSPSGITNSCIGLHYEVIDLESKLKVKIAQDKQANDSNLAIWSIVVKEMQVRLVRPNSLSQNH